MKRTPRRTEPLLTIMRRASSTPAPGRRPGRRRRWTAEQKAGYLAAFTESGLSQREFCRKMGLPSSSICLWQQRTRARKESTATVFAEVQMSEPITATATVSIHLPGGARLEAAIGADPMWLGQLIKAALSV